MSNLDVIGFMEENRTLSLASKANAHLTEFDFNRALDYAELVYGLEFDYLIVDLTRMESITNTSLSVIGSAARVYGYLGVAWILGTDLGQIIGMGNLFDLKQVNSAPFKTDEEANAWIDALRSQEA